MTHASTVLAIATLTTAMIAGFLVSYCVTLGGWFTHMTGSGRARTAQEYYTPFRVASHLKQRYGAWMLLQPLLAIFSLILNARSQPLAPQIALLLPLPLLLLIHSWSGFGKIEEDFASGKELSGEQEARYAQLNLPLHRLYALFYIIAAVWLILAVGIA
ncbi:MULTISPECIES: hypothetical protein [unclassified Actinobaculum]|uniref:hypothetical protein n=1 Tax=unclassified Actinobaculum TaxID=2609299 RepID=UPI000D52A44C|nr:MULTISPECIES: hypothetical protein [unclassified Actinobaculum]AWE41483.1 hypothetical protein DDD63_00425 [Actinobaculum sp. 313]RTE48192.1 hypothetical protein EKN07_10670 [Actinobaculum sp. 352]